MVSLKPKSFKPVILKVNLFVGGSSLEQFLKQRLAHYFPFGTGEGGARWVPLTCVREDSFTALFLNGAT